jgi:PTH1 family peptidyl-tRNA hydrolase
MPDLSLIVGLGNPGRQYAVTRHNAGFMVLQRLAERWRATLQPEKKFKARLGRADSGERAVLLCAPETYMNASGEAVGALMAFYQVPVGRAMVIVDDADLPLGQIRMRPGGSSGGHHGLDSIIQHLGTNEFARLRVGIGREPGAAREITDYVLSRFSKAEAELMEKVLTRACDQLECWLADGIGKAMSRFNGPVPAIDADK